MRLTNVEPAKASHLASSLNLAWRNPSSRTTSAVVSDSWVVEAETKRSARVCKELVESCLEADAGGREEEEEENPGDSIGVISGDCGG